MKRIKSMFEKFGFAGNLGNPGNSGNPGNLGNMPNLAVSERPVPKAV